jgi:putative Mg2+ transporter-C (MgtC) family protein
MVLAMVLAASSLSVLSPVPDLEALLRMGLSVLCGLAVGLNRAHHGGDRPHPNRVRVHVLVGLSSCLLLLAAGPDLDARSRAIQGVAAGVGFLGAGEIMTPSASTSADAPHEVRGLSSAASIWFTAPPSASRWRPPARCLPCWPCSWRWSPFRIVRAMDTEGQGGRRAGLSGCP